MIKRIIIFAFSIHAFSQDVDSLFWFDVNDLDNELPKFPLILNKVLLGKDTYSTSRDHDSDESAQEIFRIQIFESSNVSMARAEAKRFQNILGDTVYMDFETPLYKLRIGNFQNRKNAEESVESISKLGAKDAWIIRTKAKSREKL